MPGQDVSPMKYRQLRWGRQYTLLPSSWWTQGDQKRYPSGPQLLASLQEGRACYLEAFGEAKTSENISRR